MKTVILVLLAIALYTIIGIVVGIWTRRKGIIEYDDFLDPMQGIFWPVFLFFYPIVKVGQFIANKLIKERY